VTRLSRLLLRVAFVAGALLVSLVAALAEDRGMKPSYDFVVDIDGVVDKAWKMMSPPNLKTRILLISPLGDQALLVSISDKSVRPVDRMMIKNNPDGSADILAGGVFTLKPRPPLLGPHTVQDLVTDRPPFGDGIKSYQPEAAAVSYLKTYDKPTEVEVFFGSWCPVCEAWVPKFLKAVQQAGNSKIQVSLIGVSRDFNTDQNLAKAKGIRGLPTFIIRQNGIEVGRLVGAPESGTLEAALAGVLKNRS
jgi:thiol-disulfide isomerase/thioredoxin